MSGQTQTVNVQVNAIGNFSNLTSEVNKFKGVLQGIKLPDNISGKLEKSLGSLETKYSKFQSLASKGINTKGDFNRLQSSAREVIREIETIEKTLSSVNSKHIRIAALDSSEVKKAEAELQKCLNIGEKLSNFGTKKGTGLINESEVAKIQKLANTSAGLKDRFSKLTDAFKTGNIDQANAALEKLIAHVQRYQSVMDSSKANPKKGSEILAWATGVQTALQKLTTDAAQARTSLDQITGNKIQNLQNAFNGAASGINNMNNGLRQTIAAETEAAGRANQLNEQVGHLRTQANYFFGLQNMGRLIARGIREAAESVRDLDKAMTETAVVTDYSVGDMWGMLPEYTKLANKLGATTQGAYETMTLYFQQGLDKKATFEIGEETMKMARIAGLDYAETTNMMTAALRGFNMELNQTSAQRVNDVYSKLAAITASDTRELGLAMERTASIAHSAGMDFGNTTAFLAQMIETTREAPENLGTAMKTIVARFQELKENPYSISEVEGEEVDFNRVDKALKSIGVDLMDNRDKFRDLDDVFMDISSKWDGLSQTQQRYVATIAAGARQQSRFLAMVQNYDRLKELTTAAADSEGASQVQFDKTLQSYEAKVNRLKNAWQTFTMSLANNKAIKKGVDTLQSIITFGNKIIQTFGKVGGVFGDWGKSIAEMGAAFGLGAIGFKGLKGGANLGLGLLARMTKANAGNDSKFFTGAGQGNRESITLASRITNPIVNAINRLGAIMKGESFKSQAVQDTMSRNDLVAQKRRNLNNLMFQPQIDKDTQKTINSLYGKNAPNIYGKASPGAFSPEQIKKEIKDLTIKEQQAIYKSTPILQKALQRGYTNAYKSLNLTKDGEIAFKKHIQEMNKAMTSGQISLKDGLQGLSNRYSVAQAIGGESGKQLVDSIDKSVEQYVSKNPERAARITDKLFKAASRRGLEGANATKWVEEKRRQIAGNTKGLRVNPAVQLTKAEVAIGKITSGATTAGQAVMGLGMALQSAGFNTAGSTLVTIGNGIMGIGMAAQGAVTIVQSLGAAFKVLKGMSLASMAATAGPFLALGASIGLVALAIKKSNDNVKKAQSDSKKVLRDYEKTVEDTTRNITKLTDVRDQYKQLSLGVDSNNNNINLGTEEYTDYLKIVNDIAKMHPEMVKGYNANGQAILKYSNAVDQAIKAEERKRNSAEKTFLEQDSLDKLIAGRNTTKRWKATQDESVYTASSKWTGETKKERSQMIKDAEESVKALDRLDGGKTLKKIASDFGLTVNDFRNMTDDALKVMTDRGNTLVSSVESNIDTADKTTKAQFDVFKNNMAKFGRDVSGLDEVAEPIYKYLSTYASKHKMFDNIPAELQTAAQEGLKRISRMDLDSSEMLSMTNSFGNQLSTMGGHAEEYKSIMSDVEKAQEDFVKSGNDTSYLNSEAVLKAKGQLSTWIDAYRNSGDEAKQILAEVFQNQLETIENFTTSGAALLSEGFNTFADQIEGANTAFETFQKQIEGGDFYTGANNFKQIFDEIQDGVDNVGKGSATWWKGAKALLGEGNKNIESGNFKAAKQQVEDLQNMFKEGQEGADAFFEHIAQSKIQNADLDSNLFGKGKTVKDFLGLDENGDLNIQLNDLSGDQLSNLAETIGMSDQMFASMLNKAKQFYDIDFSNVDLLQKALATSESSIRGIEKADGSKDIYTKDSTFVAEAEAQNQTPAEIEELRADLTSKGVKFVKDTNDIKKSDMNGYIKGMGIETGQQFIDNFSKLGFSGDELKTLYDKYGNLEGMQMENGESFQDAYANYIDEQSKSTLSVEEGIRDEAAQANSTLSAILAAMGVVYEKGAGQELVDKIQGKEGVVDTKYNRFGKGLNESNNPLTTEEYQKTRQQIQAEYDENSKILGALIAGKEKLSGAEKKAAEEEIEARTKANDYLKLALDEGKKAFEEQTRTETTENEKKKQSWENYLSSLDNMESNQDLLTPEEAQKKFGLSDDDLASYKTKYDQITQMHQQALASMVEGAGLTKTQGGLLGLDNFSTEQLGQLDGFQSKISQISGELAKLPPEFQLSDEQVRNLGASLNGLSVSQINNLSAEELVRDLKLSNEQIAALQSAGIIDLSVDYSEATDASNAVKEIPEEKDVKVTATTEQVVTQTNETVTNTTNALANAFGGTQNGSGKKQLQTIQATQTVEVSYITTIVNEGEVSAYLDSRISAIIKKAQSTKNLQLRASVTVDYKKGKQGKAKNQEATVNYKAGKQDKPKEQTAIVNYKKGHQEKPKLSYTGSVYYNKSGQEGPSDKTAYVYYKKKGQSSPSNDPPSTGGYITSGGVLYRAKGGRVEHPGYPKKGTDIIPAYLTPGEYVQNRKAVNYFGIDFMRKINHKDLFGAIQTLGSAANGRYGRLGPKGKGGLTLTGEEGFEIAWLPSESRSMILGANGPQMVNLPSDAIVWTNEESKKIVKQKAIPMGSHAYNAHGKIHIGGGSGGSSKTNTYSRPKNNKNNKNSNNNNNNNNKNQKKATNLALKNGHNFAHVVAVAGKAVNYWWENMTRRVDRTQRKIDRIASKIEKTFSKFGTTLSSSQKMVAEYRKELNKQIGLNTTMRGQAAKNLRVGSGERITAAEKASIKRVNANVRKAQPAVDRAQAAYFKARNKAEDLDFTYYSLNDKGKKSKKGKTLEKQLKAARKEETKAKKAYDKAVSNQNKKKTGSNWQTISYEQTQWKRENGKKTSSKVTKNERINIAPYISYDPKTGAYMVDYNRINKLFKNNRAKGEAIGKAANEFIDKEQDRYNKADDNIVKAREDLEKLADDIYKTFYAWEKSITKIYFLSQKLEEITKRIEIADSRANLQIARFEAGTGGSLTRLTTALNKERTAMSAQVTGSKFNLEAVQADFRNSLNFSTYAKKYLANRKSPEAKADYQAANKAFDMLRKAGLSGDNFNYQKALNVLKGQRYNEETYNKIKEILDNINEKQSNYLDAINDTYGTITEIYSKIEEYQAFIADFEEGLLEGIEEQAENELNELEKLNSSLTKALSNLINEVKNKLDERRKKEDNTKTESDISKKQQRLAALRADTSGGNQTEIAQLQKEIADAQQSYQRTLEDQLLDKLQKQGDKAEKQRERQINLLEVQNKLAKETGGNLKEVKLWLSNPKKYKAQIKEAYFAKNDYENMTPGQQSQLRQQFESDFAQYQAYSAQLPEYQKIANSKLASIETSVDKIANNMVKLTGDRSAKTMRANKVTAKELRTLGYKASSLVKGGYATGSIVKAGYSAKDLRAAGITASAIKKYNKGTKKNKVTAKDMKKAGYSVKEARTAGFTNKQIRKGGYTATQFKKSGQSAATAKKAGYSNKSIAKAYGSTAAMTTLNMSGKSTQAITGASLTTLQKAVNKSSKDKAVQTDLAGVKASIDINGSKKAGGKVGGTVNASGRTIAANQGSTLYAQSINTKTGNPTGKVNKITIDKLQPKHFTYNKQEATQALVYAITHQALGSKINKNFKSLVKAAGIAGKEYKLKSGIYGTVDSNGKIYYNDSNKGVQKWNASTGGLSLEAYNKKTFQQKAKNKKLLVAREYQQVLDAVKKHGVGTTSKANPKYGRISSFSGTIKKNSKNKKAVRALQYALQRLGFKGRNGQKISIDGDFGNQTQYALKSFQKKNKIKTTGVVDSATKKKFKAKGYSTGGIADYTGPAWLHGTPSKPELVLNAQDTKNFMALKDVLDHVVHSTNSTNNSYGDTNVEVNINVDHISNDYDVDKLAQRIKKDIAKDAGYRNVTQVRKLR